VAIADYDNDGQADIYLLALEGSNRLFRGLGDFKFEDVTEQAGVDGTVLGQNAWGSGASFADVDNDGDLDLFVCNMNSADVLYINNGDGTFKDEAIDRGVNYVGASKMASFCDYDLDGDLDLYVVTYRDTEDVRPPKTMNVGDRVYIDPDFRDAYGFAGGEIVESGQRDFLYRNDGNGNFSDATAESKMMDYAMGLSASWLDYNDDGLPDLFVANDQWQNDRLFCNQGDGSFVDMLSAATTHTAWYSKGSDSGDLNNDGLIDLMVTDNSGSNHFEQTLKVGDSQNYAWFREYGQPRQISRNAVFLNSGAESFLEVGYMTGLSSTDWTWSTRLADFNSDGKLDVFITNGNARDRLHADIAAKISKQKDSGLDVSLQYSKKKIPSLPQSNLAFVNRGDLNFEDVSKQWGLNHNGISHGAALADFDEDGDLDMVVNNLYEPPSIYRNDSLDGNRMTIALRGKASNSFGYGSKVELWTGDTHQVKFLTPVRGYLSSDQPIVHFGLGSSTTVERMRITWPSGIVQEFRDVDAGFHYLAIEDETSATPSVADSKSDSISDSKTAFAEAAFAMGIDFVHQDGFHDDFASQPLLPYRGSQMGPGVAFGDINDDGFPDLFVGNGNNRPGALFVNRGGTIFEEVTGPWKKHFLQDDMSAIFFDADADGDQDLLVTSGGTEAELGHILLRDRLYINQQDGLFEFSENALPKNAESSSTAAAFDFDRDGDLDLVIGSRAVPRKYPNSSPTRLLRNDGGNFVDVGWKFGKPLKNVGLVNSLLCSDFNNDGWTDIILATELGPIRFIKNVNGKFADVTQQLGAGSQLGWWRGIAAGDFDSDGDMDYVATNQGINTKYEADATHPYRIYYGDFDASGRMDLVETKYEGDVLYPERGFESSSTAIPSIGKKFESFEAFAIAPLSKVYELEKHPFKEVNFIESSIIWNDGDKMRFEPLPSMAQTSPGFGVESFDFDCDGDLDILFGNNFFGADQETGLMDGGLGVLLANDGKGNFRFVWPKESGIMLNDDSMGLAIADVDLDGDLDTIVAVNKEQTRLLLNQANPSGYQKVSISGPPGNPNSIGATVVVKLKTERLIKHEVRAGGSYLSQSTNAIFLYGAHREKIVSLQIDWPTGESATIDAAELFDSEELQIDIADWPKN
jgi:hypothetical protein